MSRDCAFCAIIAGAERAEIVLDEPAVIAFLDRRPVFHGHTLVVPRAHHATFADLPPDVMPPVLEAAQRVSRTMPVALGAQGTFVAMNNIVSQSVAHLHVHVVPRTKGDGLRGFFWPRQPYRDAAQMAEYARMVRSGLREVA
ncbi:MAG: HIT family protein [Cumulibacter sp.]